MKTLCGEFLDSITEDVQPGQKAKIMIDGNMAWVRVMEVNGSRASVQLLDSRGHAIKDKYRTVNVEQLKVASMVGRTKEANEPFKERYANEIEQLDAQEKAIMAKMVSTSGRDPQVRKDLGSKLDYIRKRKAELKANPDKLKATANDQKETEKPKGDEYKPKPRPYQKFGK